MNNLYREFYFFFSALKKKETNDLKKLEEKESELYNIKSELKNTKDNLAEKNKQMTGRCDNDWWLFCWWATYKIVQGYLQYVSNKILLQCIYSTCPIRYLQNMSNKISTVHVQ